MDDVRVDDVIRGCRLNVGSVLLLLSPRKLLYMDNIDLSCTCVLYGRPKNLAFIVGRHMFICPCKPLSSVPENYKLDYRVASLIYTVYWYKAATRQAKSLKAY